jgi:uncharacterized RDD family membrane protein YckC
MSTECTDIRNGESPAGPLGEFAGARFWIRAGARIIDWGVHYAAWFVASLAFGFGLGLYAAFGHEDVGPLIQKLSTRTWPNYVFSALGLVFYHTVMEGMCGSTIGKRLLGLVVISSDGKPVSLRAALGRSFAFYVDGLFFGLPAYDSMEPPLQQRLGDKWCGTLVVKRSALSSERVVAPHSFAAILLPGLLADAACFFLAASVALL